MYICIYTYIYIYINTLVSFIQKILEAFSFLHIIKCKYMFLNVGIELPI